MSDYSAEDYRETLAEEATWPRVFVPSACGHVETYLLPGCVDLAKALPAAPNAGRCAACRVAAEPWPEWMD